MSWEEWMAKAETLVEGQPEWFQQDGATDQAVMSQKGAWSAVEGRNAKVQGFRAQFEEEMKRERLCSRCTSGHWGVLLRQNTGVQMDMVKAEVKDIQTDTRTYADVLVQTDEGKVGDTNSGKG